MRQKMLKPHELQNKLSPSVPNTNMTNLAKSGIPFMSRNNILTRSTEISDPKNQSLMSLDYCRKSPPFARHVDD